jgi:hypothetical protein
VRGSLVSLYRSLLDLSTNVEASRQSEEKGLPSSRESEQLVG